MLLQKIRDFFLSVKKDPNGKNARFLFIILFSILFLTTRLPRLANDVINPDGVLWHGRSEQFIVGIKHNQLEKTYQHYQPGVTLMWIAGVSVELYKQISGVTVYTSDTFITFDFVAKSALVLSQLVLSILIILNLSKIVGFIKSLLIVSVFTFEPFFLGGSRILHLDVLSSLLMFLALIFSYLNLKKPSNVKSIFIGLFLALSFLTKSICIGALLYIIFYSIFYFLLTKQNKNKFTTVLVIFISFIAFTFLLFPALWKDPNYYLFDMIFGEAERVGMREGHSQILLGQKKMDGGLLFYPTEILMKVSPFIVIGNLVYLIFIISKIRNIKPLIKNFKNELLNLDLYLVIFYLGYIVFMTVASKKIDRYILVIFPLFSYLSICGYEKLLNFYKSKNIHKFIFKSIIGAFILFVVIPIFRIFPWYFTYVSPIFISTSRANSIIGQKSFGVGVPDLKKVIEAKYIPIYGKEPSLGFYDTQPIRAIYPNSKIYDVRVYGPGSYDLLVLTINEDMPEKVVESDEYNFKKDHSIWINGLEYWRIYVKEDLRGSDDTKE